MDGRLVCRMLLLFVVQFLVCAGSVGAQNLAVLPFKDSTSGGDYAKLVDSIPDMLMTNLGNSSKVQLVERVQIDKAMQHFSIEKGGLIDEEKAIKVGQWVGAKWILLGSLTTVGNDARLDGRVIDVASGTMLKAASARGKVDNLFDVVDDFSEKIVSGFTGEKIDLREKKEIVLLDQDFRLDAECGRSSWGPAPYKDMQMWSDLERGVTLFGKMSFSQMALRVAAKDGFNMNFAFGLASGKGAERTNWHEIKEDRKKLYATAKLLDFGTKAYDCDPTELAFGDTVVSWMRVNVRLVMK